MKDVQGLPVATSRYCFLELKEEVVRIIRNRIGIKSE